jgi:hypothetical protein
LQSAGVLKLQSARFSHRRGTGFQPMLYRNDADDTSLNLPETIYQRPMRAVLRRLFNANYDEVAAGSFWNDVCGREVALLPAV